MTRKEALSVAIKVLSGDALHAEAADVLRKMREELPLNHWSEAAIRDAIEQFALEHGRLPNSSDFKKDRALPPHTVIKNICGKNLSAWLVENYPNVSALRKEARAAATERFIREYHRIRPRSAAEFNRERSPECRCWYTVARFNEANTWRALLAMLKLPVYGRAAAETKKRAYYVQFDADLNQMEPLQKQALQRMVEENAPAFSAPNFRIVSRTDGRFVLRYATDERLAYDGKQSGGESEG